MTLSLLFLIVSGFSYFFSTHQLGSIEEPYSCHISTFSRLGSCIGLKFLHFSSKTLYFPGKVLGGLKLSNLEVLDLSTCNNNMSTVAGRQITKLERRWFQCCFMGLKSWVRKKAFNRERPSRFRLGVSVHLKQQRHI